jgi:hypothetical protein
VDFDLNVERLIGSVLKGTLAGRRKRTRGVQRLLGRRGGLLNASSLLALAGVAWGVYETVRGQPRPGPAGPAGSPTGGSPPVPTPASSSPVTGATPPIPTEPVPSDVDAAEPPALGTPAPGVPEGVLRVIRLTLSAARADGTLTNAERDSIMSQAKQAGAESVIARELETPAPLSQIVAGVTDPAHREDLYTLAFAIVRADESVTGGERVYLAQLAYLLGLDPAAASRLEAQAATRIDDAGRDGG